MSRKLMTKPKHKAPKAPQRGLNRFVAALMAVSLVSLTLTAVSASAADSNTLMTGNVKRPTDGSGYWPTSNLREWLNGSASTVNFTSNPPSAANLKVAQHAYDKEAGFLTNFTAAEQDAIAVTERRSFVSPSDKEAMAGGGGTAGMGRADGYRPGPFANFINQDIKTTWTQKTYKTVNDKVFTLQINEIAEYVEKRGISLQKQVTPQLASKFNISNPNYAWSSGYSRSDLWGERLSSLTSAGLYAERVTSDHMGVVPAMHIKPTYVLPSGKAASTLQVGNTVTMGKYLGAPIEWTVINMTDGYPLLWASKIVTIKSFDALGDQSYVNSNSVNFTSPQVSILNSMKYTPKPGATDGVEPRIYIGNEADLNSAQTGPWTIQIAASDAGSGVDYFVTPEGEKKYGTSFTYPINANDYYDFKVVDKAGNWSGFTVPVGNIAPPVGVQVTPSTTGWSNKDVTVDIATSTAKAGWDAPGPIVFDGIVTEGPTWPEYTSYAGKKVRITGDVKMLSYSEPVGSRTVSMRWYYFQTNKVGDNYFINTRYDTLQQTPMSGLTTAGSTFHFDTTATVGGNYFSDMRPRLQQSGGSEDAGKFKFEFTNVKYELVDGQGFSIQNITLPSGQVVNSQSYTDTLTTDGTYTYKVMDSRGVTTSKDVTVKIDKVKPTAAVTGNPTAWTNQEAKIKVVGADDKSGVRSITTPNGEVVDGSTAEYAVSENGTYRFIVTDNAGNATTQNVVVSKVDTNTYDVAVERSYAPVATKYTAGDTLTWTYKITNNSTVGVTNVKPTDSKGTVLTCPKTALAVGEVMTCTGSSAVTYN
jgi:hypothetical protein